MSGIPIGIDLDGDGAHPAAWRAARHTPAELFAPRSIAARIRAVDGSGLGFATFPDGSERHSSPDTHGPDPHGIAARLDTIELATFAAAASTRIGLIPAANPIHAEPYHLANQLNTLDWASRGRAGWLVSAADSADIAAGYGRDAHADEASVAREARDVVAAVRRLWDTWEDDVLIADIAGDRFLDLDRWHYADAVGESFHIRGPGLLPRPPQGQLVVWAETIAAVHPLLVDIAVVDAPDLSLLRSRAAAVRDLGISRIVAAVEIVLDAEGRSAAARGAELDAAAAGHPGATAGHPTDRLRLTGSPADVAAQLSEIAGVVDGIRLHPAVIDVDLPVIADELLPRLDAAGALRPPDAGQSLRDLFDLPRPQNVFALAREGR